MSSFTPQMATDLFRAEPTAYLDVGDGPEIAYRRVGRGPDVLFVHGWPVSGATFRCLLPHLVDHVTCHVIDLPGAGQSKLADGREYSIARHVEVVRRVVDGLGLESVSLVGHDSGGMIARHAMAGDPRLRAMGLVNTEQPRGLSWRFRLFVGPRNVPGYGALLAWVVGQPGLRRNRYILGDAFADVSLLDGEFDELFLQPIYRDAGRRGAAIAILRSFAPRYVTELGELHRKIGAPVQMVWGDQDPFFPLPWAQEMVDTFPSAQLEVVEGAGLFVHEEAPEAVASALLPTLVGARASAA